MATTDLPSGAITFFFGDIEGSTRLCEQAPEEALPAQVAGGWMLVVGGRALVAGR